VTRPLYLVEPAALAGLRPGQALRLNGEEGRHAAAVRRTTAGEQIDVADGAGRRARCTVRAVARHELELIVDDLDEEPVPRPRLVLVQALAKGGRDELAIETATELGVDRVVPWQAGRSVVVWQGERARRAQAKWVDAVRGAAKQSRRARVPVVDPALDSAGLAGRLATLVSQGSLVLVLHEEATAPIGTVPLPDAAEDVWVVVGPEGGIDAAELARFEEVGARSVRLGPHVLRSSTAGPAALAVLAARLGRWA